MKPDARFARVTLDGPPQARAWRIYCTACGRSEDIVDGRHGASATERDKRLTERGWRIGRRRHLCPACAEPEPKPSSEPPPMAVHALPPRTPTRADNAIIHDAIDAAWDHERELYLGAASDAVISRTIDRPEKWVRDIREQFFGPNDACAARADGLAALTRIETRAAEIEDRALTLAADAEALKRDAAAARKAAGV